MDEIGVNDEVVTTVGEDQNGLVSREGRTIDEELNRDGDEDDEPHRLERAEQPNSLVRATKSRKQQKAAQRPPPDQK